MKLLRFKQILFDFFFGWWNTEGQKRLKEVLEEADIQTKYLNEFVECSNEVAERAERAHMERLGQRKKVIEEEAAKNPILEQMLHNKS